MENEQPKWAKTDWKDILALANGGALNRWRWRRIMRNVLKDCDFGFAAEELRRTLGGGVLPRRLVALLDEFDRNPGRDAAISLIQSYPNFIVAFATCSHDDAARRFRHGWAPYNTPEHDRIRAMIRDSGTIGDFGGRID